MLAVHIDNGLLVAKTTKLI